MNLKVGCSGYYYKEWKEFFYPWKMPAKDWFKFYCQNFNTLEINSTFYRTPNKKSLENWYGQSPADFLFSVKAPKLVTHIKRFNIERETIDNFCNLMQQQLKEKLACILFQMPPSFQFSTERLDLIIRKLNPQFRNVIEFRHKSWWNNDVYSILEKQDIIFCGQSYPGDIPDDVIQNSPFIYYRFHGKPILYKSLYTSAELCAVYDAVKENSKDVFVYFNNTWGESALTNAKEFKSFEV